MKLFTFQGATPEAARLKAKQELGDDYLLVTQKALQDGGYELIVALDEEAIKAREKEREREELFTPKNNSVQERLASITAKERERTKRGGKGGLSDDVSLQLSDAVRQISEIAQMTKSTPNPGLLKAYAQANKKASLPTVMPSVTQPAFPTISPTKQQEVAPQVKPQERSSPKNSEELKAIKNELDKLNDKLKNLQNMLWDDKSPKSEGIIIPHEFAEIYRIAKASGMAKEHLEKIMQLTLELMPVKMRENSVLIKRYFREVLRKMVFCRKETLNENAKKIMMFVGPTGVGKTTTLAKLAARYSRLLNKSYKVGIITLDTYRIGAVDQLMFYAKKMKLSIDTVVDVEEFRSALDGLKHCDYILIDTVGSSQHDRSKIDNLKLFVNSEGAGNIDVNLVMSATTKYEDLRDIYHTFSTLSIDTLILTKLDETRAFGNIFSLIYETQKPASYFSIGQEVPNDITMATNEFLIDCLLDGFHR